MVNIHFLEYIVEFSKTNSLTKASETLLISQSALTFAMKKLEEEAQVPLFIRKRNKLTLTDTGKEFVKYAEKVIEAEKRMMEKTVDYYQKNVKALIGFNAIGPILKYGEIIRREYAGKNVIFQEENTHNLLDNLINHVYDFVFIDEEIETEEVESLFVCSERLYASFPASHEMAKEKETTFSKIDGLSFLTADNIGVWKKIIDKNMPNSKFLLQKFENLADVIEASNIPNFDTDITIGIYESEKRVSIPILDKEASVDFYLAFRRKEKKKIFSLLKLFSKAQEKRVKGLEGFRRFYSNS